MSLWPMGTFLFIWYEVWWSLWGCYRSLQTPGNGPAFRSRDSDPEALIGGPRTGLLTSISQFLLGEPQTPLEEALLWLMGSYWGTWEACMQVRRSTARTTNGTMDWFRLGKECVKAVYRHPAYLTYMQSTSCEMPGWMKHKLESRLPREISITSDMQVTPP